MKNQQMCIVEVVFILVWAWAMLRLGSPTTEKGARKCNQDYCKTHGHIAHTKRLFATSFPVNGARVWVVRISVTSMNSALIL